MGTLYSQKGRIFVCRKLREPHMLSDTCWFVLSLHPLLVIGALPYYSLLLRFKATV